MCFDHSNIKKCVPAWYATIADEATDVAKREQLNLSIRWVNHDYEVSEDSVGLYCSLILHRTHFIV